MRGGLIDFAWLQRLEMVMNARAPSGLARVSHKATAPLVAIPTAAASSECFFELVGRGRRRRQVEAALGSALMVIFFFFGCLVEFTRGLGRRI
jgi:hypothetical protein